jgi:type IV secretion system protein VirD4
MHGSAKWATKRDLAEAGYSQSNTDPRRLILGSVNGQRMSLTPPDTDMHALICGPTGCGKTSTVYIPNLIERIEASAIITEATAGSETPDLFEKTAGYRHKKGHRIYKFNPDDLTSNRINPIEHVKTYDQASRVANLIIDNTSSKFGLDNQIWEQSERQLLTVCILHAVGEGGNLGMIRRWLREGAQQLYNRIMNGVVSEAKFEYDGFLKSSTEGFRHGVFSGLMQRLNLWVNPKIVALTEKTDIDIQGLKDELFSFYFAVPAQKTYLKPLASLIFNFILDLTQEQTFKHPLALYLDEFTNYGYVPGIAEKLTIIRHRNIPAMLGIQDFMQLQKVYDFKDAALLFSQPGTKIFFRPRDYETARKISNQLGRMTIMERKVNGSGHVQEHEFGRALMMADEVMALEKGHAIVFTPSTHPLKIETFTWRDHQAQTAISPPTFRKLEVSEELIEQCSKTKSKPKWQRNYEADKDFENQENGPASGEDRVRGSNSDTIREREEDLNQTRNDMENLNEDASTDEESGSSLREPPDFI